MSHTIIFYENTTLSHQFLESLKWETSDTPIYGAPKRESISQPLHLFRTHLQSMLSQPIYAILDALTAQNL